MLVQAVVAVTVSEAQVLLNSNRNDSQHAAISTFRREDVRSDAENGNPDEPDAAFRRLAKLRLNFSLTASISPSELQPGREHLAI